MRFPRRTSPFRLAALALLASSLAGCAGFRETAASSFLDDEGNFLVARYGVLSREYSYDIVSPVNGVKLTNKDKRLVKVQFPNGTWEDFYFCQQDVPQGTTYTTRDSKWKYWTTGIMSRLYIINEEGNDYLLVFEGTCYDPTGNGGKR